MQAWHAASCREFTMHLQADNQLRQNHMPRFPASVNQGQSFLNVFRPTKMPGENSQKRHKHWHKQTQVDTKLWAIPPPATLNDQKRNKTAEASPTDSPQQHTACLTVASLLSLKQVQVHRLQEIPVLIPSIPMPLSLHSCCEMQLTNYFAPDITLILGNSNIPLQHCLDMSAMLRPGYACSWE